MFDFLFCHYNYQLKLGIKMFPGEYHRMEEEFPKGPLNTPMMNSYFIPAQYMLQGKANFFDQPNGNMEKSQSSSENIDSMLAMKILSDFDSILQQMLRLHPKKSVSQKHGNILKELPKITSKIEQVIIEANKLDLTSKINIDFTNYINYMRDLIKELLVCAKQKGDSCKSNSNQFKEFTRNVTDPINKLIADQIDDVEGQLFQVVKGASFLSKDEERIEELNNLDCFN